MIIAIDFDGTIVEEKYPEVGSLRPHAADIIQQLKTDGHFVIIWTCRAGKPLNDAVDFLNKNNVPFDAVNTHEPNNILVYGMGAKKVYADVYVDNNQVGELPDWLKIYEFINSKKNTLTNA